MLSNRLFRAGLALLSCFLFLSVVYAAPLSVRDYGTTSSGTDIPRHLTRGDTARGIIHPISAADQSNQITPPYNSYSIFKRDEGELQFVFLARRSFWDKFKSAFQARAPKVGSSLKHFGNTVASGIKRIGRTVSSGIKRFGNTVSSGMKRFGSTVSSGIKRFGSTVTQFVETNKNKIAKVGLKALSMVEQYGGKVLANVPFIGKPLSKGLEIASKFTNQASNRIHADLGGDLGKAMAGMDEAEKIAGYLRR